MSSYKDDEEEDDQEEVEEKEERSGKGSGDPKWVGTTQIIGQRPLLHHSPVMRGLS